MISFPHICGNSDGGLCHGAYHITFQLPVNYQSSILGGHTTIIFESVLPNLTTFLKPSTQGPSYLIFSRFVGYSICFFNMTKPTKTHSITITLWLCKITFKRKIIYFCGPFSIAMLNYQRVYKDITEKDIPNYLHRVWMGVSPGWEQENIHIITYPTDVDVSWGLKTWLKPTKFCDMPTS